MSTVFTRSTRALEADGFRRSMWGVCLVAALLGAWGAWSCLARIAVYAVTDRARLEVVPSGSLKIVADFLPAAALGRLRPGQPARLRLDGFPWAQYGSIGATVTTVASEVRDGRVRVECTVAAQPATRIPLQHGLLGTLEVEVEQAAPAALVLRAAGQLLAAPSTRLESQDGNKGEQ